MHYCEVNRIQNPSHVIAKLAERILISFEVHYGSTQVLVP